MELEGRVAIVTGASRGVGAAVARALGAAGCSVVCAARATDSHPLPLPGTIDQTVATIEAAGGTARAVPTNLADDGDVARLVAAATAAFGRVDVLVNNAAITFPGDLALEPKRFDLVLAVNLRAPVLLARAVVPGMVERGVGAVLNVSSLAALNPLPGLMAYGMSKLALEHFTASLADRLDGTGVAVNCFRIDVPVASEGFLAALPDLDHSDWEPPEVAAEGIVWMLRQPPTVTGVLAGLAELREREGIMASRATRPHRLAPGMLTRNPMTR